MRAAKWRWGAVVLAVAAALAPVAPAGATRSPVEIHGYVFNPDSVRIQVKDTVRWTNSDNSGHTITAVGSEEVFDSGSLEPGESYSHTFKKAGNFRYHCQVHWWMFGTVQVDDSPVTSPPATDRPTTTTARPTTTTTARPTTTTRRSTTTTRPTATTRPPTTTRPTSTTGPSAMSAGPPASTTTAPGPTSTTMATGAAPVPAPSSAPAAPDSLRPTASPPAETPPSTPSRPSTSTTAPPATSVTPKPPEAVDPQPVAPALGPSDDASAGGVESARGLAPEPVPGLGRSSGRSVVLILTLAVLFGVGGFGAWSLIQLRPGRTGR